MIIINEEKFFNSQTRFTQMKNMYSENNVDIQIIVKKNVKNANKSSGMVLKKKNITIEIYL